MINTITSYFETCLKYGGYKVILFIDKSNFDTVKDLLSNELDKKYKVSFDYSETENIITFTSGFNSVFMVLLMDDTIDENITFNTALIDECLKGKDDNIKTFAEIYNDGLSDYPPEYKYLKF